MTLPSHVFKIYGRRIGMEKAKRKSNNLVLNIILIAAALIFAVCVAMLIFSLTGSETESDNSVKLKSLTAEKDINLYGLGGLSSRAPENTLPAFELAAESGLQSVVFDLKLTKDGVWILSRDSSVRRMTDGSGKIDDNTYFDLAGFTVDSGTNCHKYKNLKLLTLDNALDACLENGLSPVIEVNINNKKALKKLTESVINHGFGGSCTVISSDVEILKAFKSREKLITPVYYTEKLNAKQLDFCLRNADYGVAFDADRKRNDSAKIKKLISNGLEVFCFAEAEKKDFEYYVKAGVRNFVSGAVTNK